MLFRLQYPVGFFVKHIICAGPDTDEIPLITVNNISQKLYRAT